ncbi:hypothetical protein Goarm_023140, partial [Gossypium armourianum]|nr:hypothetical protein [Gossypium armourianum]
FGWIVGDGCRIWLDKDKLGFEGLDGFALRISTNSLPEVCVCDIWLSHYGGWNVDHVHELYRDFMASWICNIPILPHGPNDRMIGYELLPTNIKISTIKHNVDLVCSRCKDGDETVIHALRDCPKAQDVLVASGFDNRLLINKIVNSECAELDGLLEGIRLAQSLIDKVIFETNCTCIINQFCKNKDDITIFSYHIKEARKMLDSFSKVEVKWVDYGCNKVPDSLSNWSLSNCCNLSFQMDYPSDIYNLVISYAI